MVPAMFEGFHLCPSSRGGVLIIFKNLVPGMKKNSSAKEVGQEQPACGCGRGRGSNVRGYREGLLDSMFRKKGAIIVPKTSTAVLRGNLKIFEKMPITDLLVEYPVNASPGITELGSVGQRL